MIEIIKTTKSVLKERNLYSQVVFAPENGCGNSPGVSKGWGVAGQYRWQYPWGSSVVDERSPHSYQFVPAEEDTINSGFV